MLDDQTPHILKSSIVKTLLYSDIFDYPLTSEEIFKRLGTNHVQLPDVENELTILKKERIVFQFDRFYAIRNESSLAEKRKIGNEKALALMPKAFRRARLIFGFPFVRAVLVSGSLSKEYMDDHGDIDFFIITEPGRLWIARTLLICFKRIFLFNSHKHFCINYFIDHQHLEIEEKNIFTATELATLIPMCGIDSYHRLIASNKWLTDFFPNYECLPQDESAHAHSTRLKQIMEKLLDLRGDRIDSQCMRLTLGRWKRLYAGSFSEEDFDVAFKTRKYASKGHPKHYQKRITETYHKRIETFFKENPQLA